MTPKAKQQTAACLVFDFDRDWWTAPLSENDEALNYQ